MIFQKVPFSTNACDFKIQHFNKRKDMHIGKISLICGFFHNYLLGLFFVVLEMHVSALSLVELTGCELITAIAFFPVRLVYIKQ